MNLKYNLLRDCDSKSQAALGSTFLSIDYLGTVTKVLYIRRRRSLGTVFSIIRRFPREHKLTVRKIIECHRFWRLRKYSNILQHFAKNSVSNDTPYITAGDDYERRL